ncbi:MAG: substrate-binding domain-containing protein [Candidatus Azobacteroides sp.]|nr:substrate-binding domain-containing protein [Candidatus Azobacteroides sp.]
MKHSTYFFVLSIIMMGTLFASCDSTPKKTPDYVVPIYCDEDFEPIISTEAEVFEALNAPKGVIPCYSDEVTAVKMLLNDSVRLIVTSRRLTNSEKKMLLDTKKLVVREVLIAYDGIAIIVNKSNPDSLITVDNLKKIFMGQITDWNQLNPNSKLGKIQTVFNHPSSGTVQYVKDSICEGNALSSDLRALKTNKDVLEHVIATPNALGIIGVGWISNEKDSLQLSFSEKVSVMGITTASFPTNSNVSRPYPYSLKLRSYPFIREVYIVHTDPSLNTEFYFANFVAGERGQRIILKSGLLPATQVTRLVERKDHF